MDGCKASRGQSVPIVALVLWAVAGVAILVGLIGERAIDRARAQVGADAVALAAAAHPGPADAIAARNGVRIERLDRGVVVDVVTSTGTASAAASAESNRPGWDGLDPSTVAALRRAEVVLGERLPVVSGRRTHAQQTELWLDRNLNPYPVAEPGTSLHEVGLAVDLSLSAARRLAPISVGVGLCRPLPVSDPVHFVVCR